MQKMVFGVLMAMMMVLGMEGYNKALQNGIGWEMLDISPVLLVGLVALVMLLQEKIGAPAAGWLCGRISGGRQIGPRGMVLVRQLATVCVMCPLMSLAAALLFKHGWGMGLPLVWGQTILCNFPMALVWQVLVAGPVVRFVVGRLCR